ncbi:hypothetical protein M378DRAFT_157524 [Amanita muscaria Koide BX008]|uniref:Uncharacterized protein n=1 Tax=Amanita muscaria (strain Koide BX008) TaxID=946122 RepID=A0A0C2XIG4_AMAMK|nr:hypothetical protein M378DRAFT_157524 [Amanita muscaria Koide BX008]
MIGFGPSILRCEPAPNREMQSLLDQHRQVLRENSCTLDTTPLISSNEHADGIEER